MINTLSGAAGSASQVDTSFAAGYSDQVSQLGVVNGEIDAVQGELGDALSQLNSKTEDIKSSVQTLTGAAATLNQLADGLTSGATEMSNGAAEMGSGATEMGTAATTMGAVAGQLPTDMISQLSAVTQQCNSCKYRNKNCFRRTSETGDWYRSFPESSRRNQSSERWI